MGQTTSNVVSYVKKKVFNLGKYFAYDDREEAAEIIASAPEYVNTQHFFLSKPVEFIRSKDNEILVRAEDHTITYQQYSTFVGKETANRKYDDYMDGLISPPPPPQIVDNNIDTDTDVVVIQPKSKAIEWIYTKNEFRNTIQYGVQQKDSEVREATEEQLKNEIVKQIKDITRFTEAAIGVRLRVLHSYNGSSNEILWTTFKGSSKMTTDDLIDKIQNEFRSGLFLYYDSLKGHWSESHEYKLDTTYFELTYFKAPDEIKGGGLIPSNYVENTILGIFRVSVYDDDDNNCFFRCILHRYDPIEILEIRKKIGVYGPISKNDIPKIENLLNIHVRVYSSEFKTDIIFNDEPNAKICKGKTKEGRFQMFSAKVNFVPEIIYDGTGNECIEFVLHEEHYFPIHERIEPAVCSITGEILINEDKYLPELLIIKKLIDQKRLTYDNDVADYIEILERFEPTPETLVFDIETVYSKDGNLLPYSVAFIKDDHKPDHRQNFCNFVSQNLEHAYKISCISYNGIKFDNIILLNQMISMGMKPKAFIMGNSIGNISWGKYHNSNVCFDLYKFIGMSLMEAAEMFGLDTKKEYPKLPEHIYDPHLSYHEAIQNFYEKYGYVNVTDEMVEYNKNDVIITKKLFQIISEAFKKMFNEDIIKYMTMGEAVYKNWRKSLDKKMRPPTRIPYNQYNQFRKSLYGGMSICWNKTVVNNDKIYGLDVVSLYPYIMEKYEFPDYKSIKYYPDNPPLYDDVYGIYKCCILRQNVVVIPKRDKRESLDWTYKGVQENLWLTNIDIIDIIKYGGEVRTFCGYLFWEKKPLFRDWIQNFKSIKLQQDQYKKDGSSEYNAGIRHLAKYAQNTLSGKVSQHIYEWNSEILTSQRQEYVFLKKYYPACFPDRIDREHGYVIGCGRKKGIPTDINSEDMVKTNPCWLSVFIYALSRKYMRDTCWSYNGYIMETDSFYVNKNTYEKMVSDKPELFGSDYGQFKLEGIWDYGIFLGKKCYFLASDTECKWRFKGLQRKDRILYYTGSTDTKELWDMNKGYELTSDDNVRFLFKELLKNGSIKVITNVLERHKIDIKSSFRVKQYCV